MLSLRRAALRALGTPSPFSAITARNSRSLITTAVSSSSSTSSTSASAVPLSRSNFALLSRRSPLISTHRTYATEESEDKSKLEEAKDSAAEAAETVKEKASHAVESAKESASNAYENAKDTAQAFTQQGRQERRPNEDRNPPSPSLYVGNLYFEISEQTLKEAFDTVGPVKSVKIIYDGRGLSKGFAYVEYEDTETASKAKEQLAGQVLEGRQLNVQWAAQRTPRPPRDPSASGKPINPPSKTLFVGNMSYEMTDKDLNSLFKGLENVLEVRVAVDRRTSQPRGFAHADFVDVASAQTAAEILKDKTFYGRTLRVDYSTSSTKRPNYSKEAGDSHSASEKDSGIQS